MEDEDAKRALRGATHPFAMMREVRWQSGVSQSEKTKERMKDDFRDTTTLCLERIVLLLIQRECGEGYGSE